MYILIGFGNFMTTTFNEIVDIKSFSDFKFITISQDKTKNPTFTIPSLKTPEEYEVYFSKNKLDIKFSDNDKIYVYVNSKEIVSGGVLSFLEQYSAIGENIKIILVTDKGSLSTQLSKVVDNVLQVYTQLSNKFNSIYILDLNEINAILSGIPITGYYQHLGKFIVQTIPYIDMRNEISNCVEFNNSNYDYDDSKYKIKSIGIYSFRTKQIKNAANIKDIKRCNMSFFLDNKKNFGEIKSFMEQSYGVLIKVFPVDTSDENVYFTYSTSVIQ